MSLPDHDDAAVPISDDQLEREIWSSLDQRDLESSTCPSEIARSLLPRGEGWRGLMPRIRQVLAVMARDERVVITRGTKILAPGDFGGGPIRIRRGVRFEP